MKKIEGNVKNKKAQAWKKGTPVACCSELFSSHPQTRANNL